MHRLCKFAEQGIVFAEAHAEDADEFVVVADHPVAPDLSVEAREDVLAGAEIPLFGRICAVADVFDALTSKRPYKEAWPVHDAVAWLREQRGRHFDPDHVDAFLRELDPALEIMAHYTDIAPPRSPEFAEV